MNSCNRGLVSVVSVCVIVCVCVCAALSKDEIQAMIKFGADQIFQASGGTITDEDIDAILARVRRL